MAAAPRRAGLGGGRAAVMVRWAPAGITKYKSSLRMGVLVEHKAGLSVRSLEFGRRFGNGSGAGSRRQGTTYGLVKTSVPDLGDVLLSENRRFCA